MNDKCEWKLDSDGEFYNTQCDTAWNVPEIGDLKTNDINYCAKCGKEIEVKA